MTDTGAETLDKHPELGLLMLAVPMWIDEVRTWTEQQRLDEARRCGQHIASHGDDLQFRSKKSGRSADAFNHLARGLACAAYQPGGITAFTMHFCTDHEACKAAEAAAAEERTTP